MMGDVRLPRLHDAARLVCGEFLEWQEAVNWETRVLQAVPACLGRPNEI